MIRLAACLSLALGWYPAALAGSKVVISSNFEGGSIGKVERVSYDHLRCAVIGELDQHKRNRQASWYYFRVDGAAGRALTIDLVDLKGEYNFRPGSISIGRAARPFFSYDQVNWESLDDASVEWDDQEPRLRIRLNPARSPVWIAHVPPYTTRHLEALLRDYRGSPYLQRQTVGKTAGGRDIVLLTVTGTGRPATPQKTVWIMARQHAWESGTSWVMEGLLRFLLGDSAEAARIRESLVLKAFPMADPDGVVRGGVRFNVHGYDLNRNWDVTNPKLMPEITVQRKAVLDLVDGGRQIDLFLTLHNTNSDYLQGPLSAAGPRFRQMVEDLAERLTKTIFDAKAPRDWPPGESVETGRMDVTRGLFHARKIPALLLEQNTERNSKLGRPAGVSDYKQFGRNLMQAIAAAVLSNAPE